MAEVKLSGSFMLHLRIANFLSYTIKQCHNITDDVLCISLFC